MVPLSPNGITLFFFIAIFLIGCRTGASTQSVSWDNHDVSVNQRDNVTITCRVNGAGPFDVIRVEHILDSKNDIDNITSRIFSDNGDVKSPYSDYPSYAVTHEWLKDVVTISVKFGGPDGIRGEDSGKLKCQHLGNGKSDTANIVVSVPIKEIFVGTFPKSGKIPKTVDGFTRIKNGEEVTLKENGDPRLACVALIAGSLERAALKVTADGRDVTGSFDVESSKESRKLKPDEAGSFFHLTSTTVYAWKRVETRYNEKTLNCSSVLPTSGPNDSLASVVLRILYAPKIVCSESKVKAEMGENVTITCSIQSNPGSQVSWKDTDGKPIDDAGISFSEKTINGDRSEAFLNVARIDEKHFRTYLLVATNDVGSSNATVRLIKAVGTVGSQVLNPAASSDGQNEQAVQDFPNYNAVCSHLFAASKTAHQVPIFKLLLSTFLVVPLLRKISSGLL